MGNRLFILLEKENRRNYLVSLLDALETEYSSFAETDDYKAIVLLKAIKDLNL